MDDWVTIALILVMAVVAAGVGALFGADWGYKRGWRYGEKQARTRTLRHMKVLQDALERMGAPVTARDYTDA